jgi:hypothetical protein
MGDILIRQQCITLLVNISHKLNIATIEEIQYVSDILWSDLKPILEDIWNRPQQKIPVELFDCIETLTELAEALNQILRSRLEDPPISKLRELIWAGLERILRSKS